MLYGEKMKEIIGKMGIDTSNLPDELYSTLLQEIYDNIGMGKDEFIALLEGTKDKIVVPEGTTILRQYALYQVDADSESPNMTEIILPEGLEVIGIRAMGSLSYLEHITIPSTVKTIGGSAFQSCGSLEEVIFKGTPNTIHTATFASCSLLTSVKVPWSEGAISGAPWGASHATITYNYSGE